MFVVTLWKTKLIQARYTIHPQRCTTIYNSYWLKRSMFYQTLANVEWVQSLIITVLHLTFPPKLITWCIVLHLRLRVFKQAESGRRCWPTLRGKLGLLQLFGRQLWRRITEAFTPMKGSVELQFETWTGGWKWRHLVWNQIVAFPWKRHIVLERDAPRRARLLRPVMWQGRRGRRR